MCPFNFFEQSVMYQRSARVVNGQRIVPAIVILEVFSRHFIDQQKKMMIDYNFLDEHYLKLPGFSRIRQLSNATGNCAV